MDIDPVEDLDSIGIREILDHDSRPTFVLDLDPDEDTTDGRNAISPVFCNSALWLHESLFDAVVGSASGALNNAANQPTHEDFQEWATGFTAHDDSKDVFPLSFQFANLLWTGSTIRQRWRLISGTLLRSVDAPLHHLSSGPPSEVSTGGLRATRTPQEHSGSIGLPQRPAPQRQPSTQTASTTLVSSKQQDLLKPPEIPKSSNGSGSGSEKTAGTLQSKSSVHLAAPEKAVPDWTVPEPKGILSPHLAFARTVDWASTPLGPMESWSPEFRQVANLCMNNPHPAALFWGSELTMLYNEAYVAEVAGNKHPALMGTGFSGPFSEVWEYASPLFDECARTGISIRKDNDCLPIERRGFLEETFFSWSFTPLYGGAENKIQGFYNASFETTPQEMNRRRMKIINAVGDRAASATSVKQFWKHVLEGLEDNHFDVPFALLYSVGESEDADHSSLSSGSTISLKACHFEGSIGVPEGHPAAPQHLDLKRSREGFVPSFREAMRTREPTLLRTRDGTLPEALLDGVDWRGFGDPCSQAVIFPVRPTNGEQVLAFLLLGVNPRRPYNDDYKAFTSLLNRQLSASLASIILFEEEVRRNRDAAEAAALEQVNLTQQLALQTDRLKRMTELSPLGMFLLNPRGVLREANDRLFEMTGLSRAESDEEMCWMKCIVDGSRKTMENGWHHLVDEHQSWSGELQFEKYRSSVPVVNLNGESIEHWVLFTAQPEFASDSSLRSITGSITDISHLKWAQGIQERQLKEAEETRRLQNEFIDITSHEMRNPLSAILQCADDVSTALTSSHETNSPPSAAVVDSCLDAAHTIALCVQHQKSIVDDILTVSKLASDLLVISPVAAQPATVGERAVKMFEPELQAKKIRVVFQKTSLFQELGVSWLMLDPSRVLQVLVNLMTNAIKFTAGAAERVITVSVGASKNAPIDLDTPGFQFIPVKTESVNVASGDDWGFGEALYLGFTVQDTGCGLTHEEKKVLFERFSQASPRTHAQYGGSGLGLFISRQLAELHGGQIGVASEAGLGSTFGFFIKARRTSPPEALLPVGPDIGDEIDLSGRRPLQRRSSDAMNPPPDIVAAATTRPFDPKKLDILVVEDNLINQKVLVKQLKRVGSSVNVANDGVEALAFLEETHYFKPGGGPLTVILMDLEMPNMDGLTCIRAIRMMQEKGKIGRHVPVIAVTANVRDEQVAEAMKAGMDDVVSKPFRITDLYKKIEVVLNTN